MDILARRRFSRRLPCFILGVLSVTGLLAPAARSQSLPLFTVSSSDAQLRTIDPLTGATLTSTPITLAARTVLRANGLAKHPQTGELFAILTLLGQGPRELVKLNPATAVATDVGNTGDSFAGIAFATNGTLYGVTGDGGANPETLYTLSTTTGAATLVTPLGNGDTGETITFDPVDGLIYHASGGITQVFETIHPTTLAVTDIPQSGDAHGEATGLAHWTGDFFLLADVSQRLFLVTKNGRSRFLSAVDHFVKGMVFAGTPTPACPPPADTLFGAAHQGPDGPSLFYRIDPTTGAATLVGPVGFELVGAMVFQRTGTLFATGERMDGTNTNVLVTVNPCTGAGTEVGATGIEALSLGFTRVSDMTSRHSDGKLFAELLGTTGGELATFDASTGQATLVGLITGAPGSGNALAFSPSDTLFQSETNGPTATLSTIDPATGAPTLATALIFSPPADSFPRINAMDFQPSTGILFGSVNDGLAGTPENYLGTIDTTTGVVTLVSTTQTQAGLDALAFVPAPDLSVTKTGSPNPVIEGDTLTYTVQVTNNGPSVATSVTLTDPLPPAVTFVSATPGQGTCSNAGSTVTCNLGSIPPAAQVTVTILVRPTGAASLSNTASVSAAESDPNSTNNSATAAGTSLGFTLSTITGTATVSAGQTGRFALRVAPGAGGFPNAITFAGSNLPSQTTASFSPASTTPGNSTVDVTLSLATTAPSSMPPYGIRMRGPWPVTVPLLAACALMLLWFVLKGRQPQSPRLAALPLTALLFCVVSFFGCGGRTAPTPAGGTPPGTYSVDVTATSGTATHTTTVTLIVR